jgi:hypothetical protein
MLAFQGELLVIDIVGKNEDDGHIFAAVLRSHGALHIMADFQRYLCPKLEAL